MITQNIWLYIVVFLFGSMVGSFLNVCIYRIPRGKSIVSPSSRCPSCNNPIMPWDNVPIFSFILLRGKCRFCGKRISFKYPFVEIINAVFYVAALLIYGGSFTLLVHFTFISALVVITFIDLEFQIIPDRISLPGIVISLVFGSTVFPDSFSRTDLLGLQASITGVLLGGGLYYAIAVLGRALLKKEAMGGGDIKMMAMVGGFLGWKGVILTTFLGSLFGSVIGILLIIMKGREWGSRIPFGPYLAAGAIICLFSGQEIMNWFLYR